MTYRGLTWDHPRGRNALEAADGPITWDVQPLEGFESAPIADLCARYDLVVLDHPHLGEALAAGCLRPLDEVFAPDDLAAIAGRSIGQSYESYVMNGRPWALPLDAATQVMAIRPDLTGARPETWDDVVALSRAEGRVALSLAGPHVLMSYLSIAASMSPGLDLRDSDHWLADDLATEAAALLADLAARSPASVRDMNPIGILGHMGDHDDVALCPLIYGYVNYAAPDRRHPILFRDAPRVGGAPGSILGGTGIAISARCTPDDALCAHLLWLLGAEAQRGFIPDHDGQPSTREAWADARVNAAWGDFYRNTAATLEAASIRPRFNGYIAFQTAASEALRQGLAGGERPADMAAHLSAMFAKARAEAG